LCAKRYVLVAPRTPIVNNTNIDRRK
jgi:hypothetical protein